MTTQIHRLLLLAPLTAILALAPAAAPAATFLLPAGDENVIGEITEIQSRREDTLSDIARLYGLGFDEIRLANPEVDPWYPGEGTRVILPRQFVLPDTPREGLVLNVPEMRLYYYPKPHKSEPAVVMTYPVSIGRVDWNTPLGITKVVRKQENPTWRPPESIRAEHAADGDILPEVVPPGPDNPLGKHALYLGIPGYLIHGTNRPYGIGMRVTHGCVRMYPEDVAYLFGEIDPGTPVHIVQQPYKLGRMGGNWYVEAHPVGEDRLTAEREDMAPLIDALYELMSGPWGGRIDNRAAFNAARNPNGMPVPISVGG